MRVAGGFNQRVGSLTTENTENTEREGKVLGVQGRIGWPRTVVAALTLALVGTTVGFAQAPKVQVWEKSLAPGVLYRMELREGPLVVHAVRVSPKAPSVRVVSELAGRTVYEDNPQVGRATVGKMANESGALVAINGDFFPFGDVPTGDPLGLMVRNGELLSLPNPKRSVFAWGPTTSTIGIAQFEGSLSAPGVSPIAINGLNEECGQNAVVLNTSAAGIARTKEPSVTLVVRMDNPVYSPSTVVTGKVESMLSDAPATPVPAGRALIVARGNKVPLLAALKPGTEVTVSLRTTGFDWEKVEHAMSGGPLLVKDGAVTVKAIEEGFNAAFSEKRHPRTVVGTSPSGDLWLVAIDGRTKASVGATLAEAADIMRGLGCTEALNLDGGGSTAISLRGLTVNRPSGGVERAVANGMLVFGPKVPLEANQLRISLTPVGTGYQARVLRSDGTEVPGADVLWGSTGPVFIDQGGLVQVLDPGAATVLARVYGQSLTAALPASK